MRNPFRRTDREDNAENSPSADTRALPSTARAPRSSKWASVSLEEASTLSMVYRAYQILCIAAKQLPSHTYRDDVRIPNSTLVDKPDPDKTLDEWIEENVISLASRGHTFNRKLRFRGINGYRAGEVAGLQVLNPYEVHPELTKDGRPRLWLYRDEEIKLEDMESKPLMRLPGRWRGLSPLEAAAIEVRGAITTRDYADTFMDETGIPYEGYLTTDQPADSTTLQEFANDWVDAGKDKTKVRAVGAGLKYEFLHLTPKELQWLEAQQFNVTQIARLFGIPSSLMLAVVEGGSMTYANIEQDWLGFTRFTLMSYLLPLEQMLTAQTPRGQRVKFNIDALLRTDTLTRYQAHSIALGGKAWLTEDEVRNIEDQPPLTPEQKEALHGSNSNPVQDSNQPRSNSN